MTEERKLVRAIAYDLKEGEYIYLLLKAEKGYWQNPQGGIEPGESSIEAILRETKEETGLKVIEVLPETRVCLEYDTERKGNPLHTQLAAYAARVDSSQEIVLSGKEGHSESRWVSYAEALALLTRYPEQVKVFAEVVGKLRLG